MPKFLERKLEKEYAGLPKKERDHAVFGTMNKEGFMHGDKETAKGRHAEEKHEEKCKHCGSKHHSSHEHKKHKGRAKAKAMERMKE